jgi:hypothetical protein
MPRRRGLASSLARGVGAKVKCRAGLAAQALDSHRRAASPASSRGVSLKRAWVRKTNVIEAHVDGAPPGS